MNTHYDHKFNLKLRFDFEKDGILKFKREDGVIFTCTREFFDSLCKRKEITEL